MTGLWLQGKSAIESLMDGSAHVVQTAPSHLRAAKQGRDNVLDPFRPD